MRPRLLTAILAALGGLLLGAAGLLSLLAGESPGWHGVVAGVGYAAAVGALVVVGYGLVATAPVWLRVIVSVAFPLLAASVWQVVDQAIDDRVDGWEAAATTHLLAAAVLLAVALVAYRRDVGHAAAYEPTHR